MDRPPAGDRGEASGPARLLQSTLDDDGLEESYRGDGLGGTYRVWLNVAT